VNDPKSRTEGVDALLRLRPVTARIKLSSGGGGFETRWIEISNSELHNIRELLAEN